MRYGSVCSGIEAATIAWHPLGWEPAWLAELDKSASAVLDYRLPGVPNLGDMTLIADRVLSGEIEAPDVLVGGTPCQSFSMAGLRGGLGDARGQLTLAFVVLANAIDMVRTARGKPPVIIVWENVPGVLNHKDNPFGCLLAGLVGEDDPLQPAGRKWTNAGLVCGPQRAASWVIKDAQWFRLAQRRRRVFVVASAREGFDPGRVLLEFEGVRRDSAPRREAREDVTHPTAPCLTGSGRGLERTGDTRGQDPVVAVISDDGRVRRAVELVPTWWDGRDVSQTLDAVLHKGQTMPEKNRFPAVLQPVASAIQERAICENPHAGPDGVGVRDDDCAFTMEARSVPQGVAYEVLPFDTTQVTSPRSGNNPQWGDPCHPLARGAHPPAVCVTGDVTHTLKAEGFDASEDGTGRGQPIVCHGSQDPCTGEIAFAPGRNSGQENALFDGVRMAVRRLMPIEAERLQGFPDDWTRIPMRLYKQCKITRTRPAHIWEPDAQGRGWWLMAADGPRYKQLGNSMATPVMHWIGARIAAQVEALREDEFDALLGHNGGPPLDDEFDALLA
ncbi:DNA cytosine methyltransferase [Novosphingobium aureum]|uniref:DNA cytosine methyltransferase n=1 Tax=Novosphingobium aureum TaxID=2792964 RepID=UPI001E597B0F|nr:DNA cytosine methyltransferase [Novosphingobium aureum]